MATMTLFEENVLRLKRAAEGEATATNNLSYTEEEIMTLYEDLLASPAEEEPDVQTAIDESESASQTVIAVMRRLCQNQAEISTTEPPHRVLLKHLEKIATGMDNGDTLTELPGSTTMEAQSGNITTIVTEREWTAIIHECLSHSDIASAERVLSLIQRFNSEPSEESLNLVLGAHVMKGDASRVDKFVERFLTGLPTERQRDLHIKAHLHSQPPTVFPTKALQLLHNYEGRNLVPPQKTYSRLIGRLLHINSSVAQAHAWDLFSHMRYVAHTIPDANLFTKMICACASTSISPSGEPERALDLFTEMTVDHQIPPAVETYTATILACARSGRKEYVHEAFRLAKEMLDCHRDARGISAFSPDAKFYTALLQGAKRIGDLRRVRWILAEMVRGSLEVGTENQDVAIAEDVIVKSSTMMHVFHAYATYKPPFKPSMAVIVDGQKNAAEELSSAPGDEPSQQLKSPREELIPEEHTSFAQVPPQTHAEVVQEAEALFSRIIADQRPGSVLGDESAAEAVFRHVTLSPTLVNAYLSVHYAHSPTKVWSNLFKTLFAQVGVSKSAWSYVELLERCVRAKGAERIMALQVAEEAWAEWSPGETAWREGLSNNTVTEINARLVERVNVAMIRMLALVRQLDRAMEHVRAFVQAYPSSAIREAKEKSPLQSTRTSLLGARPLVRLISTVDVPDDTVPPLLTFTELEALHHRLVVTKRVADIKYLKWVCVSYEAALRARRDAAMLGQPPAPQSSKMTAQG
ncbi:hypothetical protein BC835DRAFT_671397 [Cytidiella melzeri]|nr:hypothetical protein BC835DRAFT_671397 [Cytidiella melzeri]